MPESSPRTTGSMPPAMITISPVNDTITTFIRHQGHDLTESQMFVATDTALQPGTRVKVEYRLEKFGQKNNIKIVDAVAEVTKIVLDSSHGRRGAIVRFVKLSPNSLALIQKILEKKREAVKSGAIPAAKQPSPVTIPKPATPPPPTRQDWSESTVVISLDRLEKLAKSAVGKKQFPSPPPPPAEEEAAAQAQAQAPAPVTAPVSAPAQPSYTPEMSPFYEVVPGEMPAENVGMSGVNDLMAAVEQVSASVQTDESFAPIVAIPMESPFATTEQSADAAKAGPVLPNKRFKIPRVVMFAGMALLIVAATVFGIALVLKSRPAPLPAIIAPLPIPVAQPALVAPQPATDGGTQQVAAPESSKPAGKEAAPEKKNVVEKKRAVLTPKSAPVEKKRPAPQEEQEKPRPATATAAPQPAPVPSPAKPPVTETVPADDTGTVIITSNPLGEIYFDGKLSGKPPVIMKKVPSGEHTILVRKDGYRVEERVINVQPGKQSTVFIKLIQAIK